MVECFRLKAKIWGLSGRVTTLLHLGRSSLEINVSEALCLGHWMLGWGLVVAAVRNATPMQLSLITRKKGSNDWLLDTCT